MPYATRGDQTLRATARDFAYYLLRDLQDPVRDILRLSGGSIPTDRCYFSGRAAGSEIACVGSNPYGRDLVTLDLLLFVTATFLLGMYFLPVAVVLSGGVKQVTTLSWHFTPKGALYGPIYGIYVG